LLGLAIGCGLLASFMTSRVLAQRSAAPATDEDDKVTVLVAKQKLTFGQRLDIPENYLEEKSYTLDQVPSKALRKFEDAQGRLVMANFIAQGTAVTSDQLMDASSMGAGGMVPSGKCIEGNRTNAGHKAGGQP